MSEMANKHSNTAPLTERVIVLGLGVTGLSVVRHLVQQGVTPIVMDSRSNPPGADVLQEQYPDINTCYGQFDESLLIKAQQLIVSPGISINNPAIQSAAEHGADVIGDIELFARQVNATVIAITGSNGKSTVTTLVGEMLRQSNIKVAVGGNIGVPALDLLEQHADVYVLELSSFQLETTVSLKPAVAVVLNVSADHMDRYANLQAYVDAKQKVYARSGVAVVNRDDVIVSHMPTNHQTTIGFTLNTPGNSDFGLCVDQDAVWLCRAGQKIIRENELAIGGRHNTANALAALAIGSAIGLSVDKMAATLKLFKGLEHRTQCVAESNGVKWFNDSKATNVGATQAAVQGLQGDIILIAGGDAKGADMTPLRDAVRDKARAVILIGRDADKIEQAIAGVTIVYHASDMQDAVMQAKQLSLPGDNVLLSPACASLDMFDNYMHRGQVFVEAVKQVVT